MKYRFTKWFTWQLIALAFLPLLSHAQAPIPVLGNPAWSVDSGTVPFMGTGNTERGGGYNPKTDHVLVVTRTNPTRIAVVNAADGKFMKDMDMTGVNGGTFHLNEIGVTADGQIFGANLTTNSATSSIKIYYWASEDAVPVKVFDGKVEAARYGDGIGVGGMGTNVKVFLNGNGNDKMAEFAFDGTALTFVKNHVVEAGIARARYGMAPVPGTSLVWVNEPTTELGLYDTATATVYNVPEDKVAKGFGDLTYFMANGRKYVATGPNFAGKMEWALVDVTVPSEAKVVAVSPDNTARPNLNATGFAAYDSKRGNLILLTTNNQMVSYPLAQLVPAPISKLINKVNWRIDAGKAPFMGTGNTERGGGYNGATDHVLVVTRTNPTRIAVLDAADGKFLKDMDMTGVNGGTFHLNEIGITPSGQIFGANLTINSTTSNIKIYYWANEEAKPALVFDGKVEAARYGDGLGIAGDGANVRIFLNGSSNDKVAEFAFDGTKLNFVKNHVVETGIARARYGMAPIPGTSLMWVNEPQNQMALFDLATGKIVADIPEDKVGKGFGDLAYFEYGFRKYVATGPNFAGKGEFAVVDVTDPANAMVVGVTPDFPLTNANATGFAAFDYKRNALIVMATNNAVVSYSVVGKSEVNTPPPAASVVSPADKGKVVLDGQGSKNVTISWTPVSDVDGDALSYRWHLSTKPDMSDRQMDIEVGAATSTSVKQNFLYDILYWQGKRATGMTLYHRIYTFDGAAFIAGPISSFDVSIAGTFVDRENEDGLPTTFAINGNYPNPFNPTTTVSFDLPEAATVEVVVSDMLGREVMRSGKMTLGAGASQKVQLNALNLASGNYVYRVEAKGNKQSYVATGRMTLLK